MSDVDRIQIAEITTTMLGNRLKKLFGIETVEDLRRYLLTGGYGGRPPSASEVLKAPGFGRMALYELMQLACALGIECPLGYSPVREHRSLRLRAEVAAQDERWRLARARLGERGTR